jgi:hypothetical protein
MLTGAPFNVLDYGADPTGTNDSRATIQAAIDAAQDTGGGTVVIPEGTYLINGVASDDSVLNGLIVPYVSANGIANRVIIQGQGRSTVLKAGNNNMYVIRFCDSHGGVNSLTIDGNGNTSVVGLGCVPEDVDQTSTLVFQLYNIFSGLYILNCDEGIAMRTGPNVAGADSGCWYNDISSTFIYSCKRGIWLMDCPVGSSGVNRNYFHQMRVGSDVNTGVQIDDGGTNVFSQVHLEGIETGTSPNTTPTAIKIKQTGASGADNNGNIFFGCVMEANTRSVENANAFTEFYGCDLGFPYSAVWTQNPKVLIGGDASITPQFAPGFLYQANSQIAGVPNNTIWPTSQIRSSNDYFTDYQKLRGISVGTIAGSSSATVTIYDAQITQQTTIQFVVTADEDTVNATNTAVGTILAKWQTGSIANIGLSAVTYAQSQGVPDYRALTTMTVTITTSSNNLQMTIANSSANQLRSVRIGLIATTS